VSNATSYEKLRLKNAVNAAAAQLALDKTNNEKYIALEKALADYEAATDDVASAIAKALLRGRSQSNLPNAFKHPQGDAIVKGVKGVLDSEGARLKKERSKQ
jgi:hypothetical protein